MTTNARKTDAQRLGNGKKAFNVKQVEKMVETAAGGYTAGDGIVIADNTISVDGQTVAMKSELPDMSDYQEKLTAGNGIVIDSNNEISSTLENMHIVDTTKYADYFEYDSSTLLAKALKDICVVINYQGEDMGSGAGCLITIPKGVTMNINGFTTCIGRSAYTSVAVTIANYQIYSNSSSKSVIANYTSIKYDSSTGIVTGKYGSESKTLTCKGTEPSGVTPGDEFRMYVRE